MRIFNFLTRVALVCGLACSARSYGKNADHVPEHSDSTTKLPEYVVSEKGYATWYGFVWDSSVSFSKGVTVTLVEQDSPAAHAKLVPGDVILAVDEVRIEDLNQSKFLTLIRVRRMKDTKRFLVRRAAGGNTEIVTIMPRYMSIAERLENGVSEP